MFGVKAFLGGCLSIGVILFISNCDEKETTRVVDAGSQEDSAIGGEKYDSEIEYSSYEENSASDMADKVSFKCSFFYRRSNELGPDVTAQDLIFQEKILLVGPNQTETVGLGDLHFSINYSSDPFEGSDLHVSVGTEETQIVSWLYQFNQDSPPINQFNGGHGFTGLVYITHPTKNGDYQFYCET